MKNWYPKKKSENFCPRVYNDVNGFRMYFVHTQHSSLHFLEQASSVEHVTVTCSEHRRQPACGVGGMEFGLYACPSRDTGHPKSLSSVHLPWPTYSIMLLWLYSKTSETLYFLVLPSARPFERFPSIIFGTHGSDGLKFGLMIIPGHLQNQQDLSYQHPVDLSHLGGFLDNNSNLQFIGIILSTYGRNGVKLPGLYVPATF